MKQLMLGNEAVARGAWEAGLHVCASYPGTPSTEITENIAQYRDIQAQWSPNEKVALEVGMGASMGGARSLVCMKHVGLNVAADPLFTASYTGVNGGLVIVVADDPGMHSSQNEQDSRHYARAAKLPMLEPSDSQECLDFTKYAFQLSEAFDTPVLLRLTTRIAHSRSLVEVGEREEAPVRPYEKNIGKYVMMPGMAKVRHVAVEERMQRLAQAAGSLPVNTLQEGSADLAIVTSGIAAQYVAEALPEATVLKLGMVYPLPMDRIRELSEAADRLVVVEELDPFLQTEIAAQGIACEGKEHFSPLGEYTARAIAEALGQGAAQAAPVAEGLPARPPVLCPGCPHRGLYYVLNKLKLTVTGDIGCYTLGATPPLSAIDSCLCMGGSVGMSLGLEKARGREQSRHTVGVIGDSTFVHSGITGLIDSVYNGGHNTIVIVDNSTTGMTGHQPNPATGFNIYFEPAPQLDLEALCRSVGVQDVAVVDPFDTKATEAALKHALDFDGVSVVICRRPCVLLSKKYLKPALAIDRESCKSCGLCLKLGCPAIVKTAEGMTIDETLCNGCDLCASLCPFNAIGKGN